MSGPPFAMSMYASETDLLRDKCAWLERELAEKVSALSETVKWVPVEERLPHNAAHALVATDVYEYPREAIRLADGWLIEGNAWQDTEDEGRVTHWMPLPEAPK